MNKVNPKLAEEGNNNVEVNKIDNTTIEKK